MDMVRSMVSIYNLLELLWHETLKQLLIFLIDFLLNPFQKHPLSCGLKGTKTKSFSYLGLSNRGEKLYL